MSGFEYAAILKMGFRCKPGAGRTYTKEYFVVYKDSTSIYNRSTTQNPVVPIVVKNAKPNKILQTLWEDLLASEKKRDGVRKSDLKAATKKKNFNKIKALQMSIQQQLQSAAYQLFEDLMTKDSKVQVFSKQGIMHLLNTAGRRGWETTGQVPGFPGPTGVTMMRYRLP